MYLLIRLKHIDWKIGFKIRYTCTMFIKSETEI